MRHDDVENDCGGALRSRSGYSFLAACCFDRCQSVLGQGPGDESSGCWFVIYNQNCLVRLPRQRLGGLLLGQFFLALGWNFHCEGRAFSEFALDGYNASNHSAETPGYAEAQSRSAVVAS